MLSIVCTKLLSTNAHLGRRVADHHFKVYIRGSRNGIAILDSDKTLICLRNALHFIGSPSCQKGRSFFLKTNHLFYLEIMEEMASYFRNVNSHCFDDSQWKIGAFLTNSFANKKKFRSIKKKIHFGLNQQPDCVVILNADRKSSVIPEADRSQIPIASLGDSTIPWESSKRITYTIPANDPIQFVYLFCHSIMKTVIIEKNAIKVVSQTTKKMPNSTFRGKTTYASTSAPRKKSLIKGLIGAGLFLFLFLFLFFLEPTTFLIYLKDPAFLASEETLELIVESVPGFLVSLYHSCCEFWRQIRYYGEQRNCATMGGTEEESPFRSGGETYKAPHVHLMLSSDSDSDSVNQWGGNDVPRLILDLNQSGQFQEEIREHAESIKEFRIDEQFEKFKNNELTKPLYERLCAHMGDADAVKNRCITEISENFHSTDVGLIDFVKQTDTSKGKRRVIFDLIKLHFQDELAKIPPEPQQNENQEEGLGLNESSSEDDSDEDD